MEFLYTYFESLKELCEIGHSFLWLSLKFMLLNFYFVIALLFITTLLLILNLLLLKQVIKWIPRGPSGKLHIAFFHPYCNAGGGGERVLWSSIRAIQRQYPEAECYIYTGDKDATPQQILSNMSARFDIVLDKSPTFIFLKFRSLVEAKYYPFLTLLFQSLGSLFLGAEALSKFRPDVYIDTMGYAFTYPLFRFFGDCYVGSYTHYPTISTDMLERVSEQTVAHNNRPIIANSFILSYFKLSYYRILAFIYGLVGRCAHVVMVNSSWTKGHISTLWKCEDRVKVVFPPCNTAKFSSIPFIQDEEKLLKTIVSIGQFRPEKDYPLQLRSFKRLIEILDSETADKTRLVLIGGVRNDDDENRVIYLKSLASDLEIGDKVVWKVNASFSELLQEVQKGTIGLHSMWNEHFGIGVVECMAGGLITVANDSGGPKMDIIVPYNGKITGFLASDEDSYAQKMKYILDLSSAEKMLIRENARSSSSRFSDDIFQEYFLASVNSILDPGRSD